MRDVGAVRGVAVRELSPSSLDAEHPVPDPVAHLSTFSVVTN